MTNKKVDELDCFCNGDLLCPYCGEIQEDEEGETYAPEGEESTFQCRDCGKKFYFVTEHTVNWTSIPMEGWPDDQ